MFPGLVTMPMIAAMKTAIMKIASQKLLLMMGLHDVCRSADLPLV